MSVQISERLRLGSERPSTYELTLAINTVLREITAKMSDTDKRLSDISSGSKATEKAKEKSSSTSPVPGATIATGTVLGRSTLREGPVEVIKVGEGLLLQGGTLSIAPVEPEEPDGPGSEPWFDGEVELPTSAGEAGQATVEHGLPGVPSIVQVWLKCVADDGTWVTGDIVNLQSALIDNGSARIPHIVRVSETEISLLRPSGSAVSISAKDTGNSVTFDPVKWVALISAHIRSSSELTAFKPSLSPGFQ